MDRGATLVMNETAVLIVVVAALGALTLVAAIVLASRRRESGSAETFVRTIAQLEASQRELGGRIAQLTEDSRSAQSALAKALDERLDKVSKRVGDSLEQTAEKTHKTMTDLQTRLAVIDEAQKNITKLSTEVVGLQDILSNKQARGSFGEIQLNDLVQTALPPSAYQFQATLSNGRRVDCLIRLPNPPGPIAVDAKFPLESYRLLRAAKDDTERLQASRAFSSDMLKHVKAIAERYIISGETAESALMFLPSEAVYAELHANFADVVEKSFRERVWIVSPTTLMATLNTVRAVLKDAQMREQASVIQREMVALIDDVARLDDRVLSLRKHFDQANEDIRQVTISAGKITMRAERIEEVQLEDASDEAPVIPSSTERLSAE
jgi:DNA recombination protein RmuC